MNQSSPRIAVLFPLCLAVGVGAAQPYVEDSIDVGGRWVGSLCYNSMADVVYGCSQSSEVFFGIDCGSHRLVTMLSVPTPVDIVYDSTDNKAYCTFRTPEMESVLVVSGTTHQRLRTIPVEWATFAVWDPVGDRVYVSCTEANEVAVIDCRTDSVITRIAVGAGPLQMHLNAPRRKLYVQNDDASSVSVVDMLTNRVIRTVYVGGTVLTGCYAAAVDKYYCDGNSEVAVLDGRSDSIVARIPLPGGRSAMAMAEVGTRRGVAMAVGGAGGPQVESLFIVDAVRDSVSATLPAGRGALALEWSEQTDLVYSANAATDNVTVSASDGSRVEATLLTGDSPAAFAYSPRNSRLYVGHYNSSMVYVIRDSATGIVEWVAQPECFSLYASPNPFSHRASISFSRLLVTDGCLRVYSISGVLVQTLRPSRGHAGVIFCSWDGTDLAGREVPAGVYVAAFGSDPALQVKLVKTE